MSEFDEDASRAGAEPAPISGLATARSPGAPPVPALVSFHRRELDLILRVYGHRVASGEWRDYAIDHLKDRAVFSVFRRSSEMPLFRIEKVPRNAKRQGAYAVVGTGGVILKRGGDLAQVLKVFEKKRHLSLV
ncbi:DUF2794 domain-containing protein [Stappia sp. 28M-7]|jgi:hypothetical protein|uniref:DUF2794 domain-containing protein n=1 Tax=Stappia sp. 28M-7 TaxID=2762596 RepID=UPI000E7248B2|nr:DUF2794 domain-containing protein [Stappia sp. 28M-7]MBC2861272.1 DUF2794 domain-containing protein [Stappia sp. 28M-7]